MLRWVTTPSNGATTLLEVGDDVAHIADENGVVGEVAQPRLLTPHSLG